jgi:hypothetical protein
VIVEDDLTVCATQESGNVLSTKFLYPLPNVLNEYNFVPLHDSNVDGQLPVIDQGGHNVLVKKIEDMLLRVHCVKSLQNKTIS